MAGHPRGIFEIYKGDDGEYYWRLKAANNRTIAIGGEGFTTKQAAIHGIYAVGKYVMKQIQGGRGKHLDICEVDADQCEHEFPRPRREFEVVKANEDGVGATVVRDTALAAEMEADLEFVPGPAQEPAPPAPPVGKTVKKKAAKKTTKKTTKKKTKKKVAKKAPARKIKVPPTDPDQHVQDVKKAALEALNESKDDGVQAGGVLPDPLSTPEGRRVIGPGPDLPEPRLIGPGTVNPSNMSADEFAKQRLLEMNEGEAVILPAKVPVPPGDE